MTFIRKIEDFVCENCGASIKGSGYTNHCNKCLFSKHVDNSPGDRANDCKGLMEPIETIYEADSFVIIHKCKKCGIVKRNKVASSDEIHTLYL